MKSRVISGNYARECRPAYPFPILHSGFPLHAAGKLLAGCVTKGIQVLGTGDALQPAWQKGWEPYLENDAGIIIVPRGEIEDQKRVHHLILAEDFAQFGQLRDLYQERVRVSQRAAGPMST